MFWCVSYHFGAFGTIWLLYQSRSKTKSRRNFSQRTHPMVRNAPKHEFMVQWGGSGGFVAKSLCHEVASEFFATNAPDPPHWTLNSSFGEFHTIWVHLGPFGCLTKPGVKQAELVQKFVPRCCVESFRNERTRSTPLDPKLMFWCVSYHLGAFGNVKLPYETRDKMF